MSEQHKQQKSIQNMRRTTHEILPAHNTELLSSVTMGLISGQTSGQCLCESETGWLSVLHYMWL